MLEQGQGSSRFYEHKIWATLWPQRVTSAADQVTRDGLVLAAQRREQQASGGNPVQ